MAKNSTPPMCSMSFCSCRERPIEQAGPPLKPPPTTGCMVVHKKFDGVAARLLSGVTAAFFASLERCSCINIATADDVDDGGSLPLILGDVIYPAADVVCTDNPRVDENHGHDHDMVEDSKSVTDVK